MALMDSFTTFNGTGVFTCRGTQWYMQTFTTTSAYAITDVALNCWKYGSPGDITVSIRETSGGLPTGEDLCSVTVADSEISTLPTLAYYTFTFDTSSPLKDATQYTIVARAPDGDTGNYFQALGYGSSGYADGGSAMSSNSGSTWGSVNTTKDANFRTYGEALINVRSVQLGSDGSFLVAAAETGVFLSTDLGDNWSRKTPDAVEDTDWIKGICSDDGTYIIVVSSANAIYRSANSGTSWGAITPAGGDTFSVNKLATSDDGQYMVIVGENTTDATESCYISTDYGATWTAKKPIAASIEWTECDISNDGAIIAVSTSSYFYISLDSGATWLEQGMASTAEVWEGLSISGDGTTGLVANTNNDNEFFIGTNTELYSEATWAESSLTSAGRAILDDANAPAQATTLGLGTEDSPIWVGATFSDLTVSSLIAADASKALESVTIGSSLSYSRPNLNAIQDIRTIASPIFAGLTVTNAAVIGSNSVVFQPGTDSTTFFQILDADGGTPVLNVDTTNEIVSGPTFNATDEDNALQIDGVTILRIGTSTDYNVFLGEGVFVDDEGQYNVGIGYKAGEHNDTTGGGARGTQNIYIGYEAGLGIASGDVGRYNVGIGYWAMRANNGGYENFALGSFALTANTTGIRNVAIGRAALTAGTNSWSVALGSFALVRATAAYNLALGYNAAGDVTTGSGNIAIGANSLNFNQEGASNTIIGYQAGGLGAGSVQTSLSNHVCIGKGSGYFLANTSDSNIFIGYKSGYNQTTSSDRLIIDNQDRGSVAAEITDCLIYSIFDATVTTQSIRFNVGDLTLASGTPYQTLWNTTHEDTDGGRESRLNFKGEQSGEEETTLARIEVSHDGTSDDQKGKIVFSVNDGDDTDTPTQALEIGSDLLAMFAGAVNIATIAAETTDVDKFLVDSSGIIKYRTGAQVLSDIGGHKYVDRGDPSGEDFDQTNLTAITTWTDIDLSSIVPAGAVLVALAIRIQTEEINATLQFRKNGNTNFIEGDGMTTQVANLSVRSNVVIACDTNRIIEYFKNSATWTIMGVTVKGWWV